MKTVLTYAGYTLETDGSVYQSTIGGRTIRFDTVGMWKSYIDQLL